MTPKEALPREETLDPQDWDAMRRLGHRMVDDMMDYLQTIRDRPVWQPIPPEIRSRFKEPLPVRPQGAAKPYQEFLETVLPYNLGTSHPRFWGWVCGPGTPLGMLADMLASAINPNMGGAHHVPNYVEAQVIDWSKEMLGFPPEASGVLVNGGSMANLICLAVARNSIQEIDLRRHGLHASPRRLMVYASSEAHSSNQKAIELLGLGSESYRKIPVAKDFRVDPAALKQAIADDRAAGYQPFCIIGCCGTTNTGAIDDLPQLARICSEERLWFHVDGAFGALAALSPSLRPLVQGIELADSLAADFHKWVYLPYDVGVVLVRDHQKHLDAFTLTPDYLAHHGDRGTGSGPHWFSDYSYETTRRFRALKVWMCLKEHGVEKIGRVIKQNVDQARYLAQLIDANPDLENLSPVSLNVVNFRFRADGLAGDALDLLNQELLIRLQESGAAVPSNTRLDSKFALHVAITNHRSKREDFDLLVAETVRLGKQLLQRPNNSMEPTRPAGS
jgi:glutamate/tyrosine decarboxylase-like PLP-dependent enzyme